MAIYRVINRTNGTITIVRKELETGSEDPLTEHELIINELSEQLKLCGVGSSLLHNKGDMLKAYQTGCLESVDTSIVYSLKDLEELKTDAGKWYKRFTE